MIFVTGDCHGNFRKFNAVNFKEQKEMTRNDYVIICGDFGAVWDGSEDENARLDWLNERPFTTLWVDGNHENFDMLKKFPVEEWHGGKVHRIRPNILHLMRGQLFDIDGFKFFTMGGAASHDIQDGILNPEDPFFEKKYQRFCRDNLMFRVKGISWWSEELPSDEEYEEALATLEKANWKVDYVISHCPPSSIAKMLGAGLEVNKLTEFFEDISQKLDFRYWFFGHYHEDGYIMGMDKYVILYREIMRIR